MKNSILCLLLVLISVAAFSQKGWRDHEMEVKVRINNPDEAGALSRIHLIGDIHPLNGYAFMYVIPAELEEIQKTGLSCEIIKDDLNAYYKDFWSVIAGQYHDYGQIIALMDSLAATFPSICKKTLFGLTPQGRQLACLTISKNVDVEENEPEVMFDGGIHGDEIGGPENLIRFARDLCTGYGNDPDITSLIDSREITIYPMVNPDGRANMSRYNSNFVDCNRDWGYMWDGQGNSTAAFSQLETRTMRNCIYNHRFVIHITYHSGEEVVLYPWCYRAAHAPGYPALVQLATIYSDSSGYPNLQYRSSYADYPTNGETIDYSYGADGTDALTMEISTSKQPPASQIGYYYQNNYPSMIAMIRNAGYGIEGTVTDSITGLPVRAAIFVNNYFPIYTDTAIGDYHEYLPAGTYTVKVSANNYLSKTLPGVVVNDLSSTLENVSLVPAAGSFAFKVAAVAIPGNNPQDEASTPAAIGAPDSINYSIGKNGWIILDMLDSLVNITGDDFRVSEGDNSPEGFTCFVAQTMDGPWISLGTGTGTTAFDLGSAGPNSARFIKIMDDGDGTQNTANAGFDLDAISIMYPPAGTGSIPQNSSLLKISPNPARDFISVSTNNTAAKGTLTIFNVEGEETMSVNMSTPTITLDIRDLEPGLYFIRLTDDCQVITGRFIKQ